MAVLAEHPRRGIARARLGPPNHGLAANIRLLGLSRFDLAYATGAVPHEQRMAMIELYGREVIPRVRELLLEDDGLRRVS
jgi:hypothetical protein